MPSDICMCATIDCKVKRFCYRFMAMPSIRQSWSHWEFKKGKCDGHMPISDLELEEALAMTESGKALAKIFKINLKKK